MFSQYILFIITIILAYNTILYITSLHSCFLSVKRHLLRFASYIILSIYVYFYYTYLLIHNILYVRYIHYIMVLSVWLYNHVNHTVRHQLSLQSCCYYSTWLFILYLLYIYYLLIQKEVSRYIVTWILLLKGYQIIIYCSKVIIRIYYYLQVLILSILI